MDNSMPFIIGKIFNSEEYAESLLNGKLFINPLAVFGGGDLWKPNRDNMGNMKFKRYNKYRDDLNEGLYKNFNADDFEEMNQLITFYNDIGGIPRNVNSIGEIDSRFLTENISCFQHCSMILKMVSYAALTTRCLNFLIEKMVEQL